MRNDIDAQNHANSLEQLMKSSERGSGVTPRPVHLWDPPYCGDMDLIIRRDGSWWHEGRPITRAGLVDLFASILKIEGDDYFLVTPVEKIGIKVEDTPFLIVDTEVLQPGRKQQIVLTSNLGEVCVAGPEHKIGFDVAKDGIEARPYVELRDGLKARIDRKSYYRLAEHLDEESGVIGLRSEGIFFPLSNG